MAWTPLCARGSLLGALPSMAPSLLCPGLDVLQLACKGAAVGGNQNNTPHSTTAKSWCSTVGLLNFNNNKPGHYGSLHKIT